MKSIQTLRWVLLEVLAFAVLGGCTTVYPEFPDLALHEYEYRSDLEGISVAAEPMTGKESEMYFGIELSESGIIPTWVRVENRSQSSLLLDPEMIALAGKGTSAPDGKSLGDGKVAQTIGGTAGVVAVGGVFLFPPAAVAAIPVMLFAGKAWSDREGTKHRIEVNALRRQTLSPDESVSGIVYANAQLGELPTQVFLRVELRDLLDGTQTTIMVPLGGSDGWL